MGVLGRTLGSGDVFFQNCCRKCFKARPNSPYGGINFKLFSTSAGSDKIYCLKAAVGIDNILYIEYICVSIRECIKNFVPMIPIKFLFTTLF